MVSMPVKILRFYRVAFAVLACFLATPSAAQNFYKGMEAYQRADYATARNEWQPLAAQGDKLAQYNLGVIYESGLGVPVDKSQALLWYRKSAKQGFALAQNNLGRMFYAGDAVVPDYARAATYFLKSAAQGVAFSHFLLGMIYAGGGPGVQADSIKAYMWLSLAGELQKSPRYRDDALSSRALSAQGMTEANITTADRLAYDWKESLQQRGAIER